MVREKEGLEIRHLRGNLTSSHNTCAMDIESILCVKFKINTFRFIQIFIVKQKASEAILCRSFVAVVVEQ